MHVLQLGPYPPPEGGINRNILAIREELVKSGHRCSIVTTSRSTKITPEPDVHHPRSGFDLIRIVRNIDSDVLHLHIGGDISKRIMALAFCCWLFGNGRKLLTVHSGGYPTTKEGRSARRNSVRGFVFRRFEKVISVNPIIAEVFERYGLERDRNRIIYPFVHRLPDSSVEVPPELETFLRSHKPLLLTVGLLEPEYDLFMQIQAMERVLERFPNAGLMIVGSGSLEQELRFEIDTKPYRDRIMVAGDVEHRVTLHLLNRSDILLRTTLFDGDAISVREALFLGTPVIATDNGMRPDGVYLIPIHDPIALISKIDEVTQESQVRTPPKNDDMSNVAEVLELYEA